MKPRLRIHSRAAADALRIGRYLDDAEPRASLGERFVKTLGATYQLIEELPEIWRVVEAPSVRRAVLEPPFDEYIVYYRTTARATTILRVLHGRRHPSTWKREPK